MPLHRGLWEQLVEQYDLVRTPFKDIAGWDFGDFLFRSEFDNVSSTIKIRQAGFTDCYDSRDRFLELFEHLAADRIIPPAEKGGGL
jgi:hypothetical protein